MKTRLHVFVDVRTAMESVIPYVGRWIEEWASIPGVTVEVYGVVRLKWARTEAHALSSLLVDAETSAVAFAACEWLKQNAPRGERNVLHCISGNNLRLGGNLEPRMSQQILQSLCPPGPTYLTATGVGYMCNPYFERLGWPTRTCLPVGNTPEKLGRVGGVWRKKLEALQTTVNPRIGSVLLDLNRTDEKGVRPYVSDCFPPGGLPPRTDILWSELDSLLSTHNWDYDKETDPKVYQHWARLANNIYILTRQLSDLDVSRVEHVYAQHGRSPVYVKNSL